jgi:predicted N-acetyltransferase YhbS
MMLIRREQPADHRAVHALHVAAFTVDPVTGAVRGPDGVPEAALVDELREDVGFLPHLSLVAVDDDVVIGHVMATRGWLEPLARPALGLGPLGVLPERQNAGVGSALVHAVLAVAEAAGERVAVLLGAPAYYRRFGFVRSTALGIEPPDPSWREYFQARMLSGTPVGGTFRYAEPFDRL